MAKAPDIIFEVQTDAELILDTPIRNGIELEAQSGGGAQEPYEGPYIITPAQTAQTLPTKQKNMANNIVVGPIPQNWGKIEYSGSVLTVS